VQYHDKVISTNNLVVSEVNYYFTNFDSSVLLRTFISLLLTINASND
jgi:hypothetical protein